MDDDAVEYVRCPPAFFDDSIFWLRPTSFHADLSQAV
jgi:hypothetical protein